MCWVLTVEHGHMDIFDPFVLFLYENCTKRELFDVFFASCLAYKLRIIPNPFAISTTSIFCSVIYVTLTSPPSPPGRVGDHQTHRQAGRPVAVRGLLPRRAQHGQHVHSRTHHRLRPVRLHGTLRPPVCLQPLRRPGTVPVGCIFWEL